LNVNFKALLAILHADTLLIILNNIMRKILLTMMALIAGTTLSFADDSYELVTSASSLQAGDEVLIVYLSSNTNYAMGAKTSSGNNRTGVKVNPSSNTITLASNNTSITRFTLGKNSNYWTFYSESEKAYLAAGSGSYLTTKTSNTSPSTPLTCKRWQERRAMFLIMTTSASSLTGDQRTKLSSVRARSISFPNRAYYYS
jgi:hypothetical protein